MIAAGATLGPPVRRAPILPNQIRHSSPVSTPMGLDADVQGSHYDEFSSGSERCVRSSLTLASYLPRYQRRLIVEGRRPGQDAFAECSHAAILMVDISGFTALTERLAKLGAAGAEQLSGILNRHLGRIAEIAESRGGDIVAFAGDSAIAMWPGEESRQTANLILAVQAALQIQSELDGSQPQPGVTLRQRAGVACGTLRIMELGGVGGRWQFAVTGEPLVDAAGAQLVAKAGEVVLSPAAWNLVKDLAVTPDSEVPDPGNGPVRVTAVREDFSVLPFSAPGELPDVEGRVSEERLLSAFEPYVARAVVEPAQVWPGGLDRRISQSHHALCQSGEESAG